MLLQCPLCSNQFNVDDSWFGQYPSVTCPTCRGTVALPPTLPQAPAPAPVPQSAPQQPAVQQQPLAPPPPPPPPAPIPPGGSASSFPALPQQPAASQSQQRNMLMFGGIAAVVLIGVIAAVVIVMGGDDSSDGTQGTVADGTSSEGETPTGPLTPAQEIAQLRRQISEVEEEISDQKSANAKLESQKNRLDRQIDQFIDFRPDERRF